MAKRRQMRRLCPFSSKLSCLPSLSTSCTSSVRKSGSVRFFCLIWTDRNRNRLPIMARHEKTGLNRKKTSPNQSKPHFPRFYYNK